MEDDIKLKFTRWMLSQAKKEKLSVELAAKYLNEDLLVKELIPHPELMQQYGLALPVSRATVARWMLLCGARWEPYKQGYYNDKHGDPQVLAHRCACLEHDTTGPSSVPSTADSCDTLRTLGSRPIGLAGDGTSDAPTQTAGYQYQR